MLSLRSRRRGLLVSVVGLAVGSVFAVVRGQGTGPGALGDQVHGGEPAAEFGVAAPAFLGGDTIPDLLVGPASGAIASRALSGADAAVLGTGHPFGPDFTGGVRFAAGDVDDDGVADVVAGMGPGGGLVRVFSGVDATLLVSGYPFGTSFTGGVSVATGDVDGDGHLDVVVGQASGGGRVRVFSVADLRLVLDGHPFGAGFTGGVHVAAGDVTGDGVADLVVGQASGALATVIDSATQTALITGAPFGGGFAGGVIVATGDVTGAGRAAVIVAPGQGPGPVYVYDVMTAQVLASVTPYEAGFTGGVFVATADFDGDGQAEIVTAPGPGRPPLVRVYAGGTFAPFADVLGLPSGFTGGVVVAAPAPGGLAFTSAPATTFTVGEAGTFVVRAVGTPPVTSLTSTGTLPAGVTFTDHGDGTATLAGTPTGPGGAFALTFTASNGTPTPATQAFTLTVEEVPAITSAAAASFSIGAPGTFTVTSTGFPVPSLMHTGTLPDGVTFTSHTDGTATLAGTPAAGTGGDYPLAFTAANGVGTAATQAFVLTVDSSPVFTSPDATTFTVGTAGDFPITTAAVPPVTAITLAGPLPSGVTFTDGGDGTARLAGAPAAATGGVYPLALTATNGVGTDRTQAFTLRVHQAPAITSAAATSFAQGGVGTFTITTTGFPAAAITAAGALPTGVTITPHADGTATLAGTPMPGTAGTYPLTLTADNGVGTAAEQAFVLTVTTDPAFTSAGAATFTVGTLGSFAVTTTAVPAVTAITLTGTPPSGVTFTDHGDGTATLAGTPAAGTGGVHALTFSASNGVGADAVQGFTLTVHEAPALTSAAATTFITGTAGSFTITTTGFPHAAITAAGALPAGISLTDHADGTATLAGTPAAGTGGEYALTLTAANGVGSAATQPFTLTVHEAPAFTSAAAATFVVGVAGTFAVTTTGFPVITAIIRGGDPLPLDLAFTDHGNGTATLAGTPGPGTGGTRTFTFTINNGIGGDVVQTFTLTIHDAPAITSGDATTFTVGTAGSFTVATTGVPPPTLSSTGALPGGVTFEDQGNGTARLAGTPAAGSAGDYPLTFTAANGVGTPATQAFALRVVCPVITVGPAGPTLADGLFGQAFAQTFTAIGGTAPYTFAITAGSLPDGLTLAAGGGLSGTLANTGVFSFTVTATDAVACTGNTAYTVTVRPNVQNDSYAGAVGNTELFVGVAPGTTPAVVLTGSILDNDAGPALTITTPGAVTTANGGQVVVNANGTFLYRPQAGDTGDDTFSYTVSSNGVTNTGTVTLGISGLVWYVNSAAGTGGDGRSHNPFNTLSAAETPSAAGSTIYVHSGAPTGNLALDASQVLFGQGATFMLNGLTIPAGVRPTLGGTVTLNNNTAVTAVNFSGAATALVASGLAATQPILIDQVMVTGGTTGLQLTNVTATGAGAVTLSNANITNTTGAEIAMNGGNIPVTVAATTTISSNAGGAITIQNRSGGTVTFAGPVNVTAGTGVTLTNNAGGSTITFAGGLALNTGATAAFTATNSGTVTATQNNTTIVNTLTTTTGTALTVTNTAIGAAGLTFRAISANGAANGIVLNNTGATAGLTVTGNGAACTSAATCTGGAIQNTSGDGLALTSTSTVSLTRLFVGGTANHGINANAVNGLTLNNARVQNAGNGDNEHGLNLINAAGTVTLDATTFVGAAEDLIHLENNSTNVTFNVINNSQFEYPAAVGGTANSAILLLPGGSASITASIQNATFTNIVGASALIGANLLNSNGTQTLTFSSNTVNITLPARASGVVVSGQELTTTNLTITSNTFNGAGGNGVISIDTNDSSTVQGTVSGNRINNPPGIGMFVAVDEAAVARLTIDANVVANSGGDGIQVVNFGGVGISNLFLALTDNQVDGHSLTTGVNFVGGISVTSFEDNACIRLRGNSVIGTPAGPTHCGGVSCVDYYIEEVGGTAMFEEIPDTAATTLTAGYVNATNDPGPVTIFGSIDLTNGAQCPVP